MHPPRLWPSGGRISSSSANGLAAASRLAFLVACHCVRLGAAGAGGSPPDARPLLSRGLHDASHNEPLDSEHSGEGERGSSIPKDFQRIVARVDQLGEDRPAPPYTSQDELNALLRRFEDVKNPDAYRNAPPVPLDGGPLPVGVRIELVKFQDLDEVAGTVNLVLDLMLCWADDRLSFNSSQVFSRPRAHAGDKLPVTSNLIWTPDIVVLNQVAEMEHMFAMDGSPLVIADEVFRQQTGVNVLWTRRINMISRCSINMSNFPFDEQQCAITIGSWAASRRQMLLVPQDSHQKFDQEGSIHTSEFQVRNITVSKKDVYMRGTAERFEEIQYNLILLRYPHYWMVNFMLPMFAVTMLTIATMWMTNAGTRMNSGTRLLLCIVQIMNITASWRPANDTDIWLDRFQTHCLALSIASVLQSLVVDYLAKTGACDIGCTQRGYMTNVVDTLLRTAICFLAIVVFVLDLCELEKQNDVGGIFSPFHGHSSRFLIYFIILMFVCLGTSSVSSVFGLLWLVLLEIWKRICSMSSASVASIGANGVASTKRSRSSSDCADSA